MPIQAIYLDPEDDFISIRDRLEWASEQHILLVLPRNGELLQNYLDMVLLRRFADSRGQVIGFVTSDGQVLSHAKILGFPTFSSPESAILKRRRWWRGRRRKVNVSRRDILDDADRSEMRRRRRPLPRWKQWTLRYLGITIYFLTLAALVIASAYAVPRATLTFRPEVVPVRVARQIVADPQLENTSLGGFSVPGRVVVSTQAFQAEVVPTGIVEIPDASARGTVVFVNQRDQSVRVPAGTRVSTSAGNRIVFQTVEEITVPQNPGSMAEAQVVAIEPGLEGNVEVNQINRIQGSLAIELDVRNLEPLTGGGIRQERAVTEADHERLRSQVLQQIQVLSLGAMESQLADQEFLARDSLRLRRIVHETYSHFPGERSDLLSLEIRAELQATIVDESQAIGLVYDALASGVGNGFELVPESLSFASGSIISVDGQGRVTFEMVGEGLMAAELPLATYLDDVKGQNPRIAQSYLFENLPLRDYPEIDIWPDWFERVPYSSARTRILIVTANEGD